MTPNFVEGFLEKLCSGDAAAAERVFVEYEPYLRLVVRRLLPSRMRPKFDSSDVVQSVWADILQGFQEAGWRFNNAGHLRAFLIKATRNRFIDLLRRHRYAADHELPVEMVDPETMALDETPQPNEIAQANELWEEMLALCPLAHQDLLRLKRLGCTLAEIAERTGLHPSSVRRIMYELARHLAVNQARRQTLDKPGSITRETVGDRT
ncbi:MAG TPA: sigma-70 family RNA polymerase sigma factor [Gemmataceae bacterium]|jgi:RNA polymerase sigma-70 factor (ECF subfamily)|nr:sigma-70 family RNA polymerase sigma factor [Gemmataceae bacterium]